MLTIIPVCEYQGQGIKKRALWHGKAGVVASNVIIADSRVSGTCAGQERVGSLRRTLTNPKYIKRTAVYHLPSHNIDIVYDFYA